MTSHSLHTSTVPIVCIGLSAGAVSPLESLLRALSSQTGMAFVVIHHLRREHPILLPSILANCTAMDVELIRPVTFIEPNHVYVIPSGMQVTMADGTLSLAPRPNPRGWSNVVTVFLDSLSKSGHRGIAVILSGMDADGSAGLRANVEASRSHRPLKRQCILVCRTRQSEQGLSTLFCHRKP